MKRSVICLVVSLGLDFSDVGKSYLMTPLTVVPRTRTADTCHHLLSKDFLENDLVAVQRKAEEPPRICAVKPDGSVAPLCQREDDVETDLFVDPREFSSSYWVEDVTDEAVVKTYGEGFYGQRPVPSLGGGPGYGAEADEIWSVTDDLLEQISLDKVDLPVIDMGQAHGEKARAGAF